MRCPECAKVMVRKFTKQTGPTTGWWINEKVGHQWFWWCGCGKTIKMFDWGGWGDLECRAIWQHVNSAQAELECSSHKTTIEEHQAFPHEIVAQIIRALEYWRDQDRGLTERTKAHLYGFYGKIYGWRY